MVHLCIFSVKARSDDQEIILVWPYSFSKQIVFWFLKIIPNIFLSKNLTASKDHDLNKLETSLSEEASIRVTAFLVRLNPRRGFLKTSPCIFLCNK